MSNRVLKKVLGEDDILTKVSPDSEDEAPTLMVTQKNKKKFNPYHLLNELSESEAKEDDGFPEEGDNEDNKDSKGGEEEDDTSARIKKRKKRPKKKNKVRYQQQEYVAGADTELEELEEGGGKSRQKGPRPHHPHNHGSGGAGSSKGILEEGSTAVGSGGGKNAVFEQLFKIDPKFLNSDFELKRIFGSRVVNSERNKTGQRRIFRHSKIILPKEQWPSISGSGISMSYLNSVDGSLHFKFDHNTHYRDVQRKFIEAVESLNPDNIVNILRMHPYHIDSHIQLSDMAKSAEDMAVAADLVEGAIHCLENALHVRFIVTNPMCRLDYIFQENRSFFILLFKHVIFVGQRACHRTALELCKRLLVLDLNDPLAVLLMIDFYAIKSGELEWFLDFYNFWEKGRNLDQLPNFAYSMALTYHLLSLKAESPKQREELSKKAENMIQYAVLMFPSVLLPLLDKVGVQIDSRAKNHNYFNSYAQSSQSRSLRLLCELYVWRSYHVWREPSVLGWLEKNVGIVLDRVDKKDPMVQDYEAKRKRRYQATTPRNILRHVILTDNKDLTFNFPPELAKEPLLNFDPLPPTDSVDIYNFTELQNRQSRRPTGRGGILNMLLDSIWNDLNVGQPGQFGDQPQHQPPEGEDRQENPPIALGGGLQQSVTALLDAMRDLLTNANGRPEGEAADGEDSTSDRGE